MTTVHDGRLRSPERGTVQLWCVQCEELLTTFENNPLLSLVNTRMEEHRKAMLPEPTCANCGLPMAEDNIFGVQYRQWPYTVLWHRTCPPEQEWSEQANRLGPLDFGHIRRRHL